MKQEIFKIGVQRFKSVEHLGYSFIHGKEKNDYVSEKHPLFTFCSSKDDEETFLKNYGNPLYLVEKTYSFVVIEKDGDKLACKFFHGGRQRRAGKTWFKVNKNVDYISINTRTGDVYVGHIYGYQKKRKCAKKIQKNFFADSNINHFFIKIKSVFSEKITDFNINELIRTFAKELYPNLDRGIHSIEDTIFKFYLEKKNIKYPNNYSAYKGLMWGKDYRKVLKKNKNRVVDTIMEINKVSGKKLKKILHECERVNISNYGYMTSLFKEEWINQDEEFLKSIIESSKNITFSSGFIEILKKYVSNAELKRIYNLYKIAFKDFSIDFYTLADHLTFYVRLKEFNETDLKWMANNREEFSKEHIDWSEKIDFYRRGEYKRIYPQYIIDELSKEIELYGEKYYTVLLNESKNYNEESCTQSNCVKTYIGKPSAFIISLRKNSVDSENRLTVEYHVHLGNERIIAKRVQTKAKYNTEPSEDWNEILTYLDSKVIKLHLDENYDTVKITKKCANGIELFSDSEFDEQGYLRWKVRTIENTYDLFTLV